MCYDCLPMIVYRIIEPGAPSLARSSASRILFLGLCMDGGGHLRCTGGSHYRIVSLTGPFTSGYLRTSTASIY
jgi:hypothetical protein